MLDFEDALNALADELKLPGLQAREENLCELAFSDLDLVVVNYPSLKGLALRARVGHIANDRFEDWLEVLSGANLFGDGPTSSVLGIEPDGAVFLTQFIPHHGIVPATFLLIFRAYFGRAHHWRERLHAGVASPTAHTPGSLHLERLA